MIEITTYNGKVLLPSTHYLDKYTLNALPLQPHDFLSSTNTYCANGNTIRTLILLLLTALGINTSHAVLSIATVHAIQESELCFILPDGKIVTSLLQLQGFTMPNRNGVVGRESIDASMAGTAISAPTGMKFKDVDLLVEADGLVNTISSTLVKNNERGGAILTNTITTGSIKATWYEGTTTPITNLNQTLTSCDGGLYTLKVEILMPVSANATYRDPNTKAYCDSSTMVTYTFTSNKEQICTIKPRDLTVYNNQYNARYFDVGKGFNVDHLKADGKRFPATGFPKAVLQIVGSGSAIDQVKYTCKLLSGATWVTLSTASGAGTNCTITYNDTAGSKPTTSVTIELGANHANGTYVPLDTYTIPAPTLWAEAGDPSKIAIWPVGFGPYTDSNIPYNTATDFSGRYLAAESCYTGSATSPKIEGIAGKAIAASKFFTRAQFLTGIDGAGFSRTADGTFMGEWGYLYSTGEVQGYPNSPWTTMVYHTADGFSSSTQYSQHVLGGVKFYSLIDDGVGVVCKR